MIENDQLGRERRRYLRLDTVFPVQFRLESSEGKEFFSPWLQGFTNNVSRGGICLWINNLDANLLRLLKEQDIRFSLEIDLPIFTRPVRAAAKVTWLKPIEGEPNKYLIGLGYEQIDRGQNNKIMVYAWGKKLFVPVVSIAIILLVLGLALNSFVNMKLVRGNRSLVAKLVRVLGESKAARNKINQITKERHTLQDKIQDLSGQIKLAEEERVSFETKLKSEEGQQDKMAQMDQLIGRLIKERNALQGQLVTVQYKEKAVSDELISIERRKLSIEKENFEKMYQWLKVHQNAHTGLLMSFEGDSDIANWAFTYDQALAIQAFTIFKDFARAKKILDFYKYRVKKAEGLFLNAYYANDGQPAEYIAHSGPNIWLGIAIMQYLKKAEDSTYLDLAEEIASTLLSLQDKDGGFKGGSNISWYSTEHNLDAYAFLGMLYKITRKDIYLTAQNKVLNWIVTHTYDKVDLPIKRGKGDSTIATDTYAWSIAAIGPKKLEDLGMNPDKILDFAEKNCAIEVSYIRPEGNIIKVKGFDFAPQRHLARGGVVSAEWTAQMALSFKIASEYYSRKGLGVLADNYAAKADEYLGAIANMIISSPSPSGQGEGCLPYASQDSVDTGHGWVIPKGRATGSVAATAYAIFAYYNFNPLELKD